MMASVRLARALRGDIVRDRLGWQILCPGPGHSPGDRSLAVRPSARAACGFIVHSHAGDDWRTCLDYVLRKLGEPSWQPPERNTDWKRSRGAPASFTDSWKQIWREAEPLGRLALDYFASRAIPELPLPDMHGVLRFHPRCPFGPGERHPCLLALCRNVITNRPAAVHRTALTRDGKKLGRPKMLGPKSGSAIKLWPDGEVTAGLVIGEGLETTLSAAARVEHRGTLLRPAWAAGDAGNLAKFPLIVGIESLTVLVDNDESGRGQKAAQECARRWVNAGREPILLTPHDLGADFNDLARTAS